MATALIIGASRGIGHALVKQYLADGWRVIATARQAGDCAALAALGAESHKLDVTDVEACAAIGWKLDGEQLDVAILNAGVYGPRHDGFPPQADFDQVMHTNVLAAMRLLPVVAPMVCAARGKLAVISSRMGSLSERDGSSGSLYRASKAALNSVLIDTAIDLATRARRAWPSIQAGCAPTWAAPAPTSPSSRAPAASAPRWRRCRPRRKPCIAITMARPSAGERPLYPAQPVGVSPLHPLGGLKNTKNETT